MNRKIGFAMIALTAAAASPSLAAGIEIDPNGAPAAAHVSPAQFVAQLMGYHSSDIGGALDPNG